VPAPKGLTLNRVEEFAHLADMVHHPTTLQSDVSSDQLTRPPRGRPTNCLRSRTR
jgi:hypothetical protein